MTDQHTDPHLDTMGLLRAELANDEVLAAADHLESCPECRDALVDDVVGHALLQRSAATLRSGSGQAPDLPLPGVAVPPSLPPLRVDTRPSPRPWVRPLVAVAAAAVLVAGTAGITRQLVRDPGPGLAGPTPSASATPTQAGAVQQARLEPLEGAGRGQVTMASLDNADDVEMTINVEDLPRTKRGQYYYAWLLEPETNKMLPLGLLGHSGKATFEVPASVLGRYRMIDVSLETDDGDPQHSITSVLRGAYA